MKLNTPTRHLLVSLGIIGLFTFFVFVVFYPSTDKLGKSFAIAILYIFIRYAALAAGILLLLIRMITGNNKNFVYILAGSLNFVLGVSCVILYATGRTDLTWLHKYLLNLFLGFIFFIDAFYIFRKTQ